MIRSKISRLVMILAVAAVAGTGCQTAEVGAPNIVIVSVDTLNLNSLEYFQSDPDLFPSFNRLMNMAARFENAYSTAPWTLPAHASLLTGLYPDRHGAIDPRTKLAEETDTLAEILQQAGYMSAAFTDGSYLDAEFGHSVGFDQYDGLINASGERRKVLGNYPRGGKPSAVHGSHLFDRGISFLSKWKSRHPPFFLFLHTYSVHDYYLAHRWTLDTVKVGPAWDHKHYLRCLMGRGDCSDEEWVLLEELYAAELRNLEAGMKRLMKAMDRGDFWGNTFFLFVSDHGEGFDVSRARTAHGGRLHEDQLRVPLLVAGPGISPGLIEGSASLVDIMPTVLELLEIPGLPGLDGLSLAPRLLRGESLPQSRALFAMEFFHYWRNGKRFATQEIATEPISVAVIQEQDWYITGPSGEEFYDMASDPLQYRNLASESETPVEYRELAASRRTDRTSLQSREEDKELEEQLRAMGYIQ